jgi:hypothetical protein
MRLSDNSYQNLHDLTNKNNPEVGMSADYICLLELKLNVKRCNKVIVLLNKSCLHSMLSCLL